MNGILVSIGRLVSNVWWNSQLTKGITIIFPEQFSHIFNEGFQDETLPMKYWIRVK